MYISLNTNGKAKNIFQLFNCKISSVWKKMVLQFLQRKYLFMKTKILNQLPLFCILLCTFSQLLNGQNIENAGFEDWDTNSAEPILENWGYTLSNPNAVIRSEDSMEGEYSVILTEIWSTVQTRIWQSIETDIPASEFESFSFYYKMEVTGSLSFHKGCIQAVLTFYYTNGHRSVEIIEIEHSENVNEWTNVEFDLLYMNEGEQVDKVVIDIRGGTCNTGVHYQGNSFSYIDDLKFNFKSITDVEDVANLSSPLIIGQNISSNEIEVKVPDLDDINDATLSIVSLQGAVVEEFAKPSEYLSIDVSRLSSGMYFLHLTSNNRVLRTEKFVVE